MTNQSNTSLKETEYKTVFGIGSSNGNYSEDVDLYKLVPLY